MRVQPVNYNRINVIEPDNKITNVNNNQHNHDNISFGAAVPKGSSGLFKNIIKSIKYSYNKCRDSIGYGYDKVVTDYGKWVLKSKNVRKFSEWLYAKDTTNATKHFAVVGALVTSAAYAYNTLKNNKLEKKNSTTLAINQSLGWIVPTLLGYLIDSGIAEHTKEVEYEFAAKITKAMKMSDLSKEEYKAALERTAKQIKGVRTIAGITTFTLLYRYLAPVFIAPVANKIGEWAGKQSDKKHAEKQEAMQAAIEPAKA